MSRARVWATISTVALLVTVCAGDLGYVEWRNHKVEGVPIGATEQEVVSIMGQPDDSSGESLTRDCEGTSRCFQWHVHQNFQYVCFGSDGKVRCHGTYVIWE